MTTDMVELVGRALVARLVRLEVLLRERHDQTRDRKRHSLLNSGSRRP